MTTKVQIAEKATIADFAEALGIELLPWQLRVVKQLEQGKTVVIHTGGQRAGHRRFRRILDAWDRLQEATNHENRGH